MQTSDLTHPGCKRKLKGCMFFSEQGVDWRVPISSPKRNIAMSGNSVAFERTRLIVFAFPSQFPRDSVFLLNALKLSCLFHPSMDPAEGLFWGKV